ncbi:methyltransferase domain-containing protein [Propionibacteriaceae bacterium Y2011]
MSSAPTPYPEAITGWLTGGGQRRILDLGSGRAGLALMLTADGHEVVCLDQDVAAMSTLAERVDPTGQGHGLNPTPVAGEANGLPFADQTFDVVTCAQVLHRFAPGLVLEEVARVLRPGGHISVVYHTRDDTVPWVKRLTRLVREFDPTVMSGDFGHGSITALEESPFFDRPERRNFRNWIPATRPQMLAMIERNPSMASLPEARREDLLRRVGELYDASARAPEPLLLPWQVSCWRAGVDHSQMTFDGNHDDGLEIPLGF